MTVEKPKKLSSRKPPAKKGGEIKGTIGGYRPGSGMPKGKVSQKVLDRQRVFKALKKRIEKHADDLFNAQYGLAVGSTILLRKVWLNKEKTKHRYEQVTDPVAIIEVMDNTQGKGGEYNENWYLVTVTKPDNNAIDSMLDRAFGRATQTINTEDDEGNKESLKFIIEKSK